MKNLQHINFGCRTYIADGKTISAFELCATAEEAVERATAWKAIGTQAEAVEVLYDWGKGEMVTNHLS